MERYNKLHFAVRNNKLAEVKAILADAAGKTMLVERTGANSEVCNKTRAWKGPLLQHFLG